MSGKLCAQCRETFHPRQANQKFCSNSCNRDFYREERREAVRRHRETEQSSDAHVD